ncbi:PREDICTED: uncharacterized protein LOC105557361 [Vollenhovia emeryi]|uniref:uncharacterized protein LOC105557361 n=1 Tax=Vollenhovia emeryi TaxID=411798 RepID=UPI0005F426B7|nr:PREDICTED: uncharacterized protein LOC105557361 [Vollenhovia emeryi]
MLSKKGTFGTFIYLGIANQLQLQIVDSEYEGREIRVLINVEGLPIYVHSKQQMWPILLQILHKDYYCKPIVVALYCGDSKPHDANDFMENFTEECTTLIEQGIVISSTLFTFRIAAFVCDTPARAFIKCCKSHTGFYGCERCEIRGKTVNKKRIYVQTNCTLRTKDSFIAKSQTDHHISDRTSPLVRIPGFDPIGGVLDYMHLLCCGVMKSLLDKWLSSRKQMGSIGRRGRNNLTKILLNLSMQISIEFQRKLFDVTNIAN